MTWPWLCATPWLCGDMATSTEPQNAARDGVIIIGIVRAMAVAVVPAGQCRSLAGTSVQLVSLDGSRQALRVRAAKGWGAGRRGGASGLQHQHFSMGV